MRLFVIVCFVIVIHVVCECWHGRSFIWLHNSMAVQTENRKLSRVSPQKQSLHVPRRVYMYMSTNWLSHACRNLTFLQKHETQHRNRKCRTHAATELFCRNTKRNIVIITLKQKIHNCRDQTLKNSLLPSLFDLIISISRICRRFPVLTGPLLVSRALPLQDNHVLDVGLHDDIHGCMVAAHVSWTKFLQKH